MFEVARLGSEPIFRASCLHSGCNTAMQIDENFMSLKVICYNNQQTLSRAQCSSLVQARETDDHSHNRHTRFWTYPRWRFLELLALSPLCLPSRKDISRRRRQYAMLNIALDTNGETIGLPVFLLEIVSAKQGNSIQQGTGLSE